MEGIVPAHIFTPLPVSSQQTIRPATGCAARMRSGRSGKIFFPATVERKTTKGKK
jgi:hypothetical protein